MAATLKPGKRRDGLSEAAEANSKILEAVSGDMAEKSGNAESRRKKAAENQMLTLNVPKDRYDEYKRLFGGAGYSLAKGTRMCLDYIYREILSGRLELTESGLRETLSSRIGRK